MELLKKRGVGVTVFVIVVIAFTLIGCHRSLSRACRDVETAFFDKTALEPYGAHTAPADQLENCVKLANRLLSVISGSDDLAAEYAAVQDARTGLSDALDAGDISEIVRANAVLVDAVSAVDERVSAGASLPPSSDDYGAVVSDFFSAQRVAGESPYNAYVEDFDRTTANAFPTNILRILSFTSLPEKFE